MHDAPRHLPDPHDPRLTRPVEGRDQTGALQTIRVVEERPLTIYLNAQEIVTAMTKTFFPSNGYLVNNI